jgi:transposase
VAKLTGLVREGA